MHRLNCHRHSGVTSIRSYLGLVSRLYVTATQVAKTSYRVRKRTVGSVPDPSQVRPNFYNPADFTNHHARAVLSSLSQIA